MRTCRTPKKGTYIMKTPLVTSVLMLSIALVFVSCENGSQLTESTLDVETQLSSKKPHPQKPPEEAELITFVGDLAGEQRVPDCCPNSGPFPAYTMTLSDVFPEEIRGEHSGNIFMNSFGRKAQWDYIVQFWWEEQEAEIYFIEIRGGEKEYNRRTKILTVTFTAEKMTIIYPDGHSTDVDVTFTLTRSQ